MLDFPSSPTTGQKFPQPPVAGVPVYTWDSAKWTTIGGAIVSSPPATALPLMDATAVVGVATKYAREDHIHPSDTTRAAQASLANYLLLTGGTLTGALTVNGVSTLVGNVFTNGITCTTINTQGSQINCGPIVGGDIVAARSATVGYHFCGSSQPAYYGFDGTNLQLVGGPAYVQNSLTVNGALSATGNIHTNGGYVCQRGIGQPALGNVANWVYGGAGDVYSFIDYTLMGQIQFVSDYRVKKDVIDLPGMWDTVKALRPIKYTLADFTPPIELQKGRSADDPFIKGNDTEQWGFIAHELQGTLIDAAASSYKDAPDALQAPNEWPVIAALTRALQEAMARIEALEAAR